MKRPDFLEVIPIGFLQLCGNISASVYHSNYLYTVLLVIDQIERKVVIYQKLSQSVTVPWFIFI